MDPLVVLGTGLAGYTVAREWRRLDPGTPLVLVTQDGGAFYSKPMLSAALSGGRAPADLVNAPAEAMARDLRAEIRTRTGVDAIDPDTRTLSLNGQRLRYAQLVLAVGADPIRLPLGGDAADAVLSVNDLDDYAAFRTALEGCRRVTLLGAGLIGCEFASDLTASGRAVEVVDPAPWPLSRLLPREAGEALRDGLGRVGVVWHLGDTVTRVDRRSRGYAVTLAGGTTRPTDLVLSAVGLRPRTALARAAELAADRGIVVDRHLETSRPGVFALGDCAQVDGLVLPYVMPIMHAARSLARTLSVERTPVSYPAMPVVVKTPAWPTVVAPPLLGATGEWSSESSPAGVKSLFRDAGGRLLGFALSGDRVAEKNALARDIPPWLA
jgi:rubredoxin-NAD+ reductase